MSKVVTLSAGHYGQSRVSPSNCLQYCRHTAQNPSSTSSYYVGLRPTAGPVTHKSVTHTASLAMRWRARAGGPQHRPPSLALVISAYKRTRPVLPRAGRAVLLVWAGSWGPFLPAARHANGLAMAVWLQLSSSNDGPARGATSPIGLFGDLE